MNNVNNACIIECQYSTIENLTKEEVGSVVRRLRSNMLVHSYIYYWLNDNIITDFEFDFRAKQLALIQQQHPKWSKIGFYDRVFWDWDGSTGCHLPKDDWVVNKALYVLEIHEKYKEK